MARFKDTDNTQGQFIEVNLIEQLIPGTFEWTIDKGMNRFTLRTERKVDIQWKMYCIVHNIGKCIRPLGMKYGA
jgi:hypothetical protein